MTTARELIQRDVDTVMKVAERRPVVYAAQIVCCCGARLGIVETSYVNTHQCADCGRVYSMQKVTA